MDDEGPWIPPRERAPPPMDHRPGWKPSAYSPAMGELICARIEAGETIRQITACEGTPSYATVFRWLQVNAGFARMYGELRDRMAAEALRHDADVRTAAAWRRQHEWKLGRRRHGKAGRGSSFTQEKADALCARIAAGESVLAVTADPAMPSAKVMYRWARRRPDFAAQLAEARAAREFALRLEIEAVVLSATPATLAACRRQAARLEGRIGRLKPRKFRPDPRLMDLACPIGPSEDLEADPPWGDDPPQADPGGEPGPG